MYLGGWQCKLWRVIFWWPPDFLARQTIKLTYLTSEFLLELFHCCLMPFPHRKSNVWCCSLVSSPYPVLQTSCDGFIYSPPLSCNCLHSKKSITNHVHLPTQKLCIAFAYMKSFVFKVEFILTSNQFHVHCGRPWLVLVEGFPGFPTEQNPRGYPCWIAKIL